MKLKPPSCRFAVVGAGGPAGLAAMKVLSEELQSQPTPTEYELVGFEEREDIGGFWQVHSCVLPHPGQASSEGPISPMYDSMMTNLPYPIMCYASYRVPRSPPLFSNALAVQDYLREYAQHFNFRHRIIFGSRVTAATWDEASTQWKIVHLKAGKSETSYFDRLVVSTGRHPYVPEIPGFDTWLSSESRGYIHSSEYRNSVPYRGCHVLVIGDGPSAWDISEEIAPVASRTIRSIRSLSGSTASTDIRGAVSHFSLDGLVHFQDGTSAFVDRVVFTTGYQYDYSFLTQVPRHEPDFTSDHLYISGFHVYPLALSGHLTCTEIQYPIFYDHALVFSTSGAQIQYHQFYIGHPSCWQNNELLDGSGWPYSILSA
ncbi:flavin-containing monooxygenase/FMO family protein [Ceratobasidium sp. AG-Ba]|nr:flavin-containing monooxygenase/FMO family protein [Ceratobasidium sp. AG-Ba]